MSSFRKGKTDASSLQLYSLPRRELQAMCEQYGIPTNKTNTAMADALSACAPIDTARPKAWGGANSLRISKATPSKVKVVTGLPEASLTSNGKRKLSPVKPTVGDRDDASFLKSNTVTPLRRGVKRSERPLVQTPHEEKTKATIHPAYPRAAALQYRFGKSVAATRPQAPTPGKRPGKVVEAEMSYTEIEFRNDALHRELFGGRRGVSEDQGVTPGADVSNPSVEVGFEFRDMALHKELFGSHPKLDATNSQGYATSRAHDLQPPGATVERGVFSSPLTSSPEVLDYSGLDVKVLSSIREEDASDGSGRKVEKLQEPQGRDLGPLLDDMSCDSPSRMEEDTNLAFGQVESAVMSPKRCSDIQNSPLVEAAATPLTKIRNNIGCTLTKATSILEKLTALRADAEKKRREGYWEPKFSAVVENASPVAVFKTDLVVERGFPSAKKARRTPKALSSSEKGLVVCEDTDIVSVPSAKSIRIPDGSRDLMSDKENQSETKSMGDRNSRKLCGFGKEKKIEVLKDRSKNMSDHVHNEISEPGSTKPGGGEVRPEEMSLRKLRAQFKERIRHLEASKASDLRPWSERMAWNTSR